jgi:tetratricopeptide (TPR) repeat protein
LETIDINRNQKSNIKMSENSNSKRFAMTKFRERGVLVERLAEAFKTKTPEQMTEVNNATAEFVVHNTELRSAFDADAVCATQFFTLCKRTHWVVDAEGANLNLLAKSTDPVVQYGDSLNAGFHDACRPPCGAPLAQLTPLTSLFDIGCMANANARLDRYLLCRVTALVPFAQDELYLVAEDAERTEFWVRFPPYDSRVCKAMFSDGPDCVVALKAPQVALHGANWDPLLLAFSADCELLHDRSSELLRGTPWFVAPADTPLDWKLRGNASFAKQRHCEAAACYSRGLELDADNVDLRANRANAYLKVGEWHKALDDADAVLARDAKHLKCAMRRASALFKLARIADADAAWKRARALAVTAADIGECEQAARKLAAADARSRGKVDSSGSGDDDLSTYVHPNIARVPSAKTPALRHAHERAHRQEHGAGDRAGDRSGRRTCGVQRASRRRRPRRHAARVVARARRHVQHRAARRDDASVVQRPRDCNDDCDQGGAV